MIFAIHFENQAKFVLREMKRNLLLIICLLFLNVCFGQNKVLNGEIRDSLSGEPLPYATVEIFDLKTGTITDKDGKFTLQLASDDFNPDNTIRFSYVGYEPAAMTIQNFMESAKIISLHENPVILDEIKVIPGKYSTMIVGVEDMQPQSLQYANVFSGNKGNFIGNRKKKPGWIKSVSYYIQDDGYPTTPFRVRIYGVDEHNKPGKDILNKNVIVSAKRPGWLKVDLSEYNIPFPEEGLFVMMEWINSGDKFYFEKEVRVKGKNGEPEMVKRKYYGQSLGTVSKKGGVIMWGNSLGNEWIPYDFSYKGNYVNAMINAEVIYEQR